MAIRIRRRLLQASIAESTARTYASGMRKYIAFCQSVNITPFPVCELGLELFVASCAASLAAASIKVYLAGIQFHSRRMGHAASIADMRMLADLLKGLKRVQGNLFSRPQRSPFTVTSLYLLCDHIGRSVGSRDGAMLKAAALTAFFGMLRSAEFCCPQHTRFDPAAHLLFSDVTFSIDQRIAYINIKASKTDPFRKGTVVRVCSNNSPLCPLRALRHFMGLHPHLAGPLFFFQDGSFLTRTRLSETIKSAFPPSTNLNTHSFRIGGASAACAMGLSDAAIKELGRWRSDAYKKYVQLPDKFFSRAQRKMVAFLT